ncbi:hypothetical protein DFH06DRAFT_1289538 [Mycena polygramma]|nr:hypothetical protein DFH06DRAFT_1289538 [Mycena polygramma]
MKPTSRQETDRSSMSGTHGDEDEAAGQGRAEESGWTRIIDQIIITAQLSLRLSTFTQPNRAGSSIAQRQTGVWQVSTVSRALIRNPDCHKRMTKTRYALLGSARLGADVEPINYPPTSRVARSHVHMRASVQLSESMGKRWSQAWPGFESGSRSSRAKLCRIADIDDSTADYTSRVGVQAFQDQRFAPFLHGNHYVPAAAPLPLLPGNHHPSPARVQNNISTRIDPHVVLARCRRIQAFRLFSLLALNFHASSSSIKLTESGKHRPAQLVCDGTCGQGKWWRLGLDQVSVAVGEVAVRFGGSFVQCECTEAKFNPTRRGFHFLRACGVYVFWADLIKPRYLPLQVRSKKRLTVTAVIPCNLPSNANASTALQNGRGGVGPSAVEYQHDRDATCQVTPMRIQLRRMDMALLWLPNLNSSNRRRRNNMLPNAVNGAVWRNPNDVWIPNFHVGS